MCQELVKSALPSTNRSSNFTSTGIPMIPLFLRIGIQIVSFWYWASYLWWHNHPHLFWHANKFLPCPVSCCLQVIYQWLSIHVSCSRPWLPCWQMWWKGHSLSYSDFHKLALSIDVGLWQVAGICQWERSGLNQCGQIYWDINLFSRWQGPKRNDNSAELGRSWKPLSAR